MSSSFTTRVRRVRDEVRRRQRLGINIRLSPLTDEEPSILFLTPDFDAPSGGIRVVYRHVDILNAAGIRASVLHHRRGFRCTWFQHDTRITSVPETVVKEQDLLVVGELDVDILAAQGIRQKHAIFNQSGFMTWSQSPDLVDSHYRSGRPPELIVTVSDYARSLLELAFPTVPVERVHLSIDPVLFHPSAGAPRRRITYFGRRSGNEVASVLRLLTQHPALAGWEVVELARMSHGQVAAALRSGLVFLTASHQEGFGLPLAEAMASGSYAVGYHGFGGREFMLPEISSPVEVGDLAGMARALVAALEYEQEAPGWLRARGVSAAAHVATEFSPDREAADVVRIYSGAVSL